jgi:putative peptide zinc metalloprotease protein
VTSDSRNESDDGTSESAQQNDAGFPQLRGDLVFREIEMGDQPMVVCKDPLSRCYFYFSQSEYELLGLADGNRSTDQISVVMTDRYPTAQVYADAVASFFSMARQQGLIQSYSDLNASSSLDATASRIRTRRIGSLLAIRFRGIHPGKLLDLISPIGRLLFCKTAKILWVFALAFCVLAMLIHVQSFADDLASIASNPLSSFFWIAAAVGTAKVIHELGHAMACRYLGCECPAIGFLLLLGIPCLYADVSDAWMLRRRSDRMFISAAGMYLESWIAILATFVWLTSNPGDARDISATLIAVCSVSTLLINANPLLRYDGYYLLSDVTGTANLASRARSSLTSTVNRWIGRTPTATSSPWMSAYALASLIYRWIVLFTVIMIIFQTLKSFQLEDLGTAIVALIVGIAFVKQVARFKSRPAAKACGIVATCVILLSIPIPQNVVAPMMIHPARSHSIQVTEPGFLEEEIALGRRVGPQDVIARLSSPTLVQTHAAAVAAKNTIDSRLSNAERARSSRLETGVAIPTLRKTKRSAEMLVNVHGESLKRLDLVATKDGMLFPPITMVHQHKITPRQTVPMAGQWITAGHRIAIVGDPHRRDAILYLRDQQLSKVSEGMNVTFLIPSVAKNATTGTVVSIGSKPCRQFPSPLVEKQWLNPSESNVYPVHVRLDSSGDNQVVFQIGKAKIETSSESILARIYRMLFETFA